MDDVHPDVDAATLARIIDELPGRIASKAHWWTMFCLVAWHGPITAEELADRVNTSVDHAGRGLRFLADQGLVDALDSGGAYACTSRLSDSSITSSKPSSSLVPTGSALERSHTCDVELTWVPPAVVRGGGFLDDALALCAEFAAQVEERGDRRASNRALTRAWVLPMEAMIRLDGHEPAAIRKVMAWLHAGRDEPSAFWRNNVLSPTTLRTRWDRMATQYAAAKRGKPSKSSAVLQHPGAPRLADRLGANRG